MQRKALIIGATGRIGQALVQEISSLYATVTVIARHAPKFISKNMLVYTVPDFDNLEQVLSSVVLDEKTDMFCCLSGEKMDKQDDEYLSKVYFDYPLNFIKICHQKNVRRLFLLSKISGKQKTVHDRLHAVLSTFDWQLCAVFLVDKITLSDDYSVKNLGKKAMRLLQSFLLHEEPLTPKQIAVSMALVAFWTLYDGRYIGLLKPSYTHTYIYENINYISHEQILNLTNKNF